MKIPIQIKIYFMSWGNKLLLVFIAFAGGLSYMAYRCMQSPVELVAKEYYRDELAYQNVINGTNNANALSRNISIYQEAAKVIIEFPPEMQDRPLKGNILFYCASNESKDRNIKLNLVSGGKLELDKNQLAPGQYIVKITWNTHHTDYYSEKVFTII